MPEDLRHDEIKPLPLDYRPPEPGVRPERVVFAVIGGFITGCGLLSIPGAAIFMVTHPSLAGGHVIGGTTVGIVLYAILCVAAIAGAVRSIRRWRERRQYFLSGFLLGVGATALLEGICFGVG